MSLKWIKLILKKGVYIITMSKKLTLEECREFAKNKGGECISKKYVSACIKMYWRCSQGHCWEAVFNNIKNNGSWCPKCGGTSKHTIKTCQNIAKEKGGKCLSEE